MFQTGKLTRIKTNIISYLNLPCNGKTELQSDYFIFLLFLITMSSHLPSSIPFLPLESLTMQCLFVCLFICFVSKSDELNLTFCFAILALGLWDSLLIFIIFHCFEYKGDFNTFMGTSHKC